MMSQWVELWDPTGMSSGAPLEGAPLGPEDATVQAVPGAGSSVLRKPAALAEAAHTRPCSAAPMAAPGIFLVSVLLLLCGPGPYPAAADSQPGVKCVLFNEEYMNCTWGNEEMPTVNYSLFYWNKNTSDKAVECKHYLQHQGVRVGCHFKKNELIQFQPFHVLVNASVGGKTLEIPKRMELQDLVKPEAPVNLTIRNMSNNQLQLTWASPYPRNKCLEHAVKYKSNKDTSWTELSVNGDVFSLPSVDYEKSYTFYVRSKINKFCGRTQFWSEWSVPVIWGSNSTKGTVEEELYWFGIRTVLVPIASCLLLLVLVILLVRMERVWVILMPRIPNPSKNFDELFITHNGNFQEWTGVPKDIVESFKPNYSENICYVTELPPKDSHETLWDSSNHAPPPVPGPPAAPSEHSPYQNSYGRV